MKSRKGTLFLAGLVAAALFAAPGLATVEVTVDPAAGWIGWMNWYDLPEDGGAYVAGGAWGTPDLPAVFTGDELKLSPNTNTYNAADPYWVKPDGSGNKWMEANMYFEDTGMVGESVTFTGLTPEYSLVSPYESKAFIKVLDSNNGWALVAEVYDVLEAGQPFSVSLDIAGTAGLIPQFGFMTTGPNANPETVDQLGYAIVTAIPEPASALLLLAVAVLIRRR
ncbi:MAG: hypothetical protein JXO22_05975 [Phycisphaerae bacterium]|nr:hypothetical protein [Phycisphaerae bacterium]